MAKSWGVLSPANYAGTDQGVDFTGAGPIPALDDATVTSIRRVSIIEGGSYPLLAMRLNAGPYAGRYLYVMENFTPTVRVGQKVRQGQTVGVAKGTYPYIEYGFAADPSGTPAAPLYPNPHGAKPEGAAMWSYIQTLVSGHPPPVSGNGALPPGSGLGAPSTSPASFLGSPVGTTEALAVRLAFALAGVALLVVALVLWSKATTRRTVIAAAGGFLAGEEKGRRSSSAPRPPAPRRVTHVYRDETDAERRRRMAAGAEPSNEIPF